MSVSFVSRTIVCATLLVLPVLPMSAVSSASQAQESVRTPHDAIRPFIDSDTVLIGWLDLSQLDLPQLREFAESAGMDSLPKIPQGVQEIQRTLVELGVTRVYWVSSLAELVSGPRAVLIPVAAERADQVALLLKSATGDGQSVVIEGDLVLAGEDSAIEGLSKAVGQPRENVLSALARSDGPNGIVIGMTEQGLQVVAAMLNRQESQLRMMSENLLRLLPDVRSVTLHGHLPPTSASLHIQTSSGEIAAELGNLLRNQTAILLEQDAEALAMESSKGTLTLRKTSLEASREALRSLLRLLQPARDAAHRKTVMNSLKQHALGMHNFHDVHGRFPPQKLVSDSGEAMLSWRVLILPYLGHRKLYDQFRLHEPWDSEHNMQLVEQMPDIFRSPDDDASLTAAGRTRFVAPLTESSVLGRPGESVRIRDITDGTSNTLMIVQTTADQAVVWTRPGDLVIGNDRPVFDQIAGEAAGIALCACDGAAHYLRRGADDTVMRALISIDGGELAEWPHE